MRRRCAEDIDTKVSSMRSVLGESDSQENISEFEAAQTEKAAVFFASIAPLLMSCRGALLMTQAMRKKINISVILLDFPRQIIFWLLLAVLGPYVRKQIKRYPVIVASAIQCIAHAELVYSIFSLSLKLQEVLMQHRSFVGMLLLVQSLTAANLYMPMPVFVLLVCPIYISGWLFFHASLDFMTVPCILWIFCTTGLAVYVRHNQTAAAWGEFQAVRALYKERLWMQSEQESFRSILSSIFDASCTCDNTGVLKELSPQLRELLNVLDSSTDDNAGSDDIIEGLNLCSFAANEAESVRLSSFLATASSCSQHQASKIQCGFRCGTQSMPQFVDACLYATVLHGFTPCRGSGNQLFIVFQIQISQSTVNAPGDNGSVPARALEASEEKTLAGSRPAFALEDAVVYPLEQSLVESLELPSITSQLSEDDDDGSRHGSLSYSKGKSTIFSARGTDTSSAWHSLLKDATTQTETGSAARPPQVDREKAFNASRRERGRNVRLNTSRRVLRRFVETPPKTVETMITVWMASINTCGRGCCAYHIIVARLVQLLGNMRRRPCNQNFVVYSDWQCSLCGSMNEDIFDDDDAPQCVTCEQRRIPQRVDVGESATDED